MTDTHVLDATDVRALKHATSLVFHHRDGEGFIRAILDADHSSTGFEQEHRIAATMSSIHDYSQDSGLEHREYDAAVVMLSAQYHEIGRTLVRHMRAGTQFTLEWWRNNSSPVTKELGFVRDELRIKIGKDRKVADTFLVDVYAGKDNTARMVRLSVNGVLR